MQDVPLKLNPGFPWRSIQKEYYNQQMN